MSQTVTTYYEQQHTELLSDRKNNTFLHKPGVNFTPNHTLIGMTP